MIREYPADVRKSGSRDCFLAIPVALPPCQIFRAGDNQPKVGLCRSEQRGRSGSFRSGFLDCCICRLRHHVAFWAQSRDASFHTGCCGSGSDLGCSVSCACRISRHTGWFDGCVCNAAGLALWQCAHLHWSVSDGAGLCLLLLWHGALPVGRGGFGCVDHRAFGGCRAGIPVSQGSPFPMGGHGLCLAFLCDADTMA